MKRFSTLHKAIMLLVAFTATVLQAHAGSTWYAYYGQLNAWPTGAGEVYLSQDNQVAADQIQWGAQSETKFVSTVGSVYGFAKPAEGWILAGFSQAKFDENDQPVFNDSIATTANPGYLTVNNTVTDDPSGQGGSDSATVAGLMPLDPNGVFRALFTHVVARAANGQDELGTVRVSPVCNNIGDNVTLTATPSADFANTKFDRWTLNGQTVSTDATMQVAVTDTARYVAHFTSDDAETIDFGEGRLLMYYPGDATDVSIPTNVETWAFKADSMRLKSVDGNDNCTNPSTGGFNIPAANPFFVYGKGEATLVRRPAATPNVDPTSLNRWAATEVNVDTLDKLHSYYTLDVKNRVLKLAPAGTVLQPRTVYMALPDSVWDGSKQIDPVKLDAAPAMIYLSKGADVPNAISALAADKKKAVRRGIYTLDGRKVEAMKETGIYVFDGRKVAYRKK